MSNNPLRIEVGDIVAVSFHNGAEEYTISTEAEVLQVPESSEGTWIFKTTHLGHIYYISERCTVMLLKKATPPPPVQKTSELSAEDAYNLLQETGVYEVFLTTSTDQSKFPQFCRLTKELIVKESPDYIQKCWTTKRGFLEDNSGQTFRII